MACSRLSTVGCHTLPLTPSAHRIPSHAPHPYLHTCTPLRSRSRFIPFSASQSSSSTPHDDDAAAAGMASNTAGTQDAAALEHPQQASLSSGQEALQAADGGAAIEAPAHDLDSAPSVILQEAWQQLQEVTKKMKTAVAQEDYRVAAAMKREADRLREQMSPVQLYLMEQVELLESGTQQQKMDAVQVLWDCSFTTLIPEYLQGKAAEAVVAMFGEPSPLPEVQRLVREFSELLFQSNEDEVAAFSVFKQVVDLDPDKAMLMASILKTRVVNSKVKRGSEDGGPSSSQSGPDSAGPVSGMIITRRGPDSTPDSLAGALPPELHKVLHEEGIPVEVFDDDNLWQSILSDSAKEEKVEDKPQQTPRSKPRRRMRAVKPKSSLAAPPLRRPPRRAGADDAGSSEKASDKNGHEDDSNNMSRPHSTGGSRGAPEMSDEEMVYMCAMLVSGGRDDKARGIAKLWDYCSNRRVSFEFQVLALAAVRNAFKPPVSPSEQQVIDVLCLNVFSMGADPEDVLMLYLSLPSAQSNLDNSVLIGIILCHRLGIDMKATGHAQPEPTLLPCQQLILPGSSSSFSQDMAALALSCRAALTAVLNSAQSVLSLLPWQRRPAGPPLLSSGSHYTSSISPTRTELATVSYEDDTWDDSIPRATRSQYASPPASTSVSQDGDETHTGRKMGPEPPPPAIASSSGRASGETSWSDEVVNSMLTTVMHVPPNMRREVFQEVLGVIKLNISKGVMRVSPELVQRVQEVEKALDELPMGGRMSEEGEREQSLVDMPDAVALVLLSENMTIMRSASTSMDAKLTALVKMLDAHLNNLLPDYMLRLAQEATVAMFPPTSNPELQGLITAFGASVFAPNIMITDACMILDRMVALDSQHAYTAGSILECILEYDMKHVQAQETATELGALFASQKKAKSPRKGGKRRSRKADVEPPLSDDESDSDSGGSKP